MSEKELYDLALSDVPKYSLLNEILAIRDKRFPDEETDYTIKVYGSISLDVLNKYVDVVNNWNELKKWLEEEKDKLIKACSHHYTDSFDRQHAVNEDIYDELVKVSDKMQELENRKV